MKHFFDTLEKYIDFHFALAVVAILAIAGSLYLEFNKANTEFEILNASTYFIIQNQSRDSMENASVDHELDELGKSLDSLNF